MPDLNDNSIGKEIYIHMDMSSMYTHIQYHAHIHRVTGMSLVEMVNLEVSCHQFTLNRAWQ